MCIWRVSLIISWGFFFFLLHSTGSSDQWGCLWFSPWGCQWGWCSCCWRSVPNSILPELQEQGRCEGHLQKTVGCVHQEKCGLPDCWGSYTERFGIFKKLFLEDSKGVKLPLNQFWVFLTCWEKFCLSLMLLSFSTLSMLKRLCGLWRWWRRQGSLWLLLCVLDQRGTCTVSHPESVQSGWSKPVSTVIFVNFYVVSAEKNYRLSPCEPYQTLKSSRLLINWGLYTFTFMWGHLVYFYYKSEWLLARQQFIGQ